MYFDPIYFLFVAPAMLLAMWAQFRVKSAYAQGNEIAPRSGYSGAQAAEELLRVGGVRGVRIEQVDGFLTDHYDPTAKVLRLSPEVYTGRTLSALGIAAHECGHAFQDAGRYPLLVVRNALVPLASIGSGMSWLIIAVGFLMSSFGLVMLGIGAFSMTVLFQLVNLPVEYDASRRAKLALAETGLVTREESVYVQSVLSAAALTYVAATLSSILTLLYFLYRSGLLGGRRES